MCGKENEGEGQSRKVEEGLLIEQAGGADQSRQRRLLTKRTVVLRELRGPQLDDSDQVAPSATYVHLSVLSVYLSASDFSTKRVGRMKPAF